jgi:uncharacterized protein
MAKLSDEVKALFEKQLAFVATAGANGTPNVGPKGSMYIVDDETLAYSESANRKTLKNLMENSRVAVTVVDREKGSGYQVKGRTELLSSGNLFDQMARRQQERGKPQPEQVVKIIIEEIYPV